ncbi:MAG TPA: MXAN_5187 family protein [Anaeromyxobacteraceae bacterium]
MLGSGAQVLASTAVFGQLGLMVEFDTPPATRYDRPAMNRLKVWLYMALLLGAGTGNLYFLSRWLTDRALAQIDHDLRTAATQVDARSQLLASEAAQLADVISRDPSVAQALSPGIEGDAGAAAQTALEALRGSRANAGPGLLVATAGRSRRSFRVNGRPIQAEAQADVLLSEAAAELVRREGHVLVGDALYYVVAVPAARGASVGVGVPVSPAWLGLLRASTGADLTVLLERRVVRSTLSPQASAIVASAASAAAGQPVAAGKLAPQELTFPAPVPVMALPLPFASAPAFRVEAIALKGLPGGVLVLSEATGPLLAPVVSYVWGAAAALVLLVLVGVGVALLVTNEQKTLVPKELLAAADRVARGDFAARAPAMLGALGTVATALNRATAVAEHAAQVPGRPDDVAAPNAQGGTSAPGRRVGAPGPAEAVEPAGRSLAAVDVAAAERAPLDRVDGAAGNADVEPEAQRGAPPPPNPVATAKRVETRTEDLLKLSVPEADARATPGLPAEAERRTDDEAHWQAVYEEFLRVRETCGEPRAGVPYDRFREKLQRNRDQLMEKYACRTVRFQVYVKEGKAALKASPLR